MTRRGQLLALRDRIAAATGPDRELDYAIAKYFGTAKLLIVPVYTGSLDAAVTLLPEDFAYWEVNTDNGAGCRATIVMNASDEKVEVYAATPALAICLARIEHDIAKEQT